MFKPLDNDTKNIFKEKVLDRTTGLELVINEKCQNSCTYCYRKYKHKTSNLFSMEAPYVKNIIDKFLELIEDDGTFFNNRIIELYGGDPMLDYQHTKDVLNIANKYKPKRITLPTNARLVSELNDIDIEKLFEGLETQVMLSLSVDGIESDNQRPLSKIGKMLGYDEKINYEKIFKLSRKYRFGFHPMLSFKHIESWFDTVKFFLEGMGVVPYLLEVRHPLSKEKSIEAVKQLVKIRRFYETLDDDGMAVKISNTLKASQVPRGLGCSALTTLLIMPNGDIPFCHRVIDPPWVYGNVFHGIDITKAISLTSIYDHRNVPECMACPIRQSCSGLCQGACYEYWGDPWIPIPSICDFYILKSYIFSKLFDDWNGMISQGEPEQLERKAFETFGEDNVKHIIDDSV
jgi:radical SAM protein with 4Fe4S-binding SPASM domain